MCRLGDTVWSSQQGGAPSAAALAPFLGGLLEHAAHHDVTRAAAQLLRLSGRRDATAAAACSVEGAAGAPAGLAGWAAMGRSDPWTRLCYALAVIAIVAIRYAARFLRLRRMRRRAAAAGLRQAVSSAGAPEAEAQLPELPQLRTPPRSEAAKEAEAEATAKALQQALPPGPAYLGHDDLVAAVKPTDAQLALCALYSNRWPSLAQTLPVVLFKFWCCATFLPYSADCDVHQEFFALMTTGLDEMWSRQAVHMSALRGAAMT